MDQWIVPGQPGRSGVPAIELANRAPGSERAKRIQFKSGAASLAKENQKRESFAISRAALWTAFYLYGAAGQCAAKLVTVGSYLELAAGRRTPNSEAKRATSRSPRSSLAIRSLVLWIAR